MKIEDWDFHTRCGILWRFQRTPYGVSSIISSLFEKKMSFFRVVISRYLIKIEDWDFHTRCGISCRWTMPRTIFSVNLTVTEIFEDEKNLWNSVFLKYLSNGTIFWHQFFYGAAQGNSGFDMHWLDMIIFIRIWDIYTKAKIWHILQGNTLLFPMPQTSHWYLSYFLSYHSLKKNSFFFGII